MIRSVISFQSSPSPKAGSYEKAYADKAGELVFQSSPSPKAGSYQGLLWI